MGAIDQPIRWGRLAACVALGCGLQLLGVPGGLSPEGWRVFCVFTSVIAGFLLRPIDMGPLVLLGLVVLVATRAVPLEPMIKGGFGDYTVWLVVAAFLIADAVEATGLGRRIALLLLQSLGKNILGLAYAIAATELVLAPFIPSNTARGGGVVSPIVRALAESLGSRPRETPRLGGAYLHQVGSHANLVTSAMFLTAMAGNNLLLPPVKSVFGIDFDFRLWALGGAVPGLVSLALLPLLFLALERPAQVDLSGARSRVAEELRTLGPWKPGERRLAGVLVSMLALWSLGKPLENACGIELKPTTVALGGVCALLLLRIRTWREVTLAGAAWDSLIWLGGFVSIAESLKATGFTAWFSGHVERLLAGFGALDGVLVLALIYFASMFLFSQMTAHIAALGAAFLAVGSRLGAPPLLTIALLAYFGCLCGAMTPWSSGPVIIHFQNGYVSVGRWMRNGLLVAIVHLAVWLTVGLLWWRWLGWWSPPTKG